MTGASSGIGEAIARQLAQRGYRVGLVARNEEKLRKLADELGGAEVFVCDLADATARDRLVEEIGARGLRVELLVNNAGYAAAKTYVLALSDALHEETRKTGVTVTALCPGPVHSGFQEASGAQEFAKTLPKPMWRKPDAVAKAAIKAADRGKRLVVPGAPNRISGAAARFSPRPVLLRVLRMSGS